jgi:hypothetical protein
MYPLLHSREIWTLTHTRTSLLVLTEVFFSSLFFLLRAWSLQLAGSLIKVNAISALWAGVLSSWALSCEERSMDSDESHVLMKGRTRVSLNSNGEVSLSLPKKVKRAKLELERGSAEVRVESGSRSRPEKDQDQEQGKLEDFDLCPSSPSHFLKFSKHPPLHDMLDALSAPHLQKRWRLRLQNPTLNC